MMNDTLRWLALAAGFAAAGAVAAAEITLYENDNFNGRRVGATASISILGNTNFNDRASSVVVQSGQWQLCSDAYFRGRCVSLGPGRYPSLSSMGLNDQVSSVRELWDHGSGGGGGGDAAGADLVLYDGYNFGGESFRVGGAIVSIGGSFNDRANSAIVYNGNWEMCVDADFGGGCQVFGPGRHANLGFLSGRVSSLRPVGGGGRPGGGGGGPPGGAGWGGGNRAILYEGPNLSGRYFIVDRYMGNLDATGFNDRASSLRVERGYWMFCSNAGFQGECRTFGPGDYPSLPRGLANRISSGRRISDDYPYQNNPNWDGQR
ncbi:MAG: beta/gamma crystallin-related protein [Betaproteobacteria bacterium]